MKLFLLSLLQGTCSFVSRLYRQTRRGVVSAAIGLFALGSCAGIGAGAQEVHIFGDFTTCDMNATRVIYASDSIVYYNEGGLSRDGQLANNKYSLEKMLSFTSKREQLKQSHNFIRKAAYARVKNDDYIIKTIDATVIRDIIDDNKESITTFNFSGDSGIKKEKMSILINRLQKLLRKMAINTKNAPSETIVSVKYISTINHKKRNIMDFHEDRDGLKLNVRSVSLRSDDEKSSNTNADWREAAAYLLAGRKAMAGIVSTTSDNEPNLQNPFPPVPTYELPTIAEMMKQGERIQTVLGPRPNEIPRPN